MLSSVDPEFLPPLVLGVQMFGLLTGFAARLSRGSRNQSSVSALFAVTLVAVAVSTMLSQILGNAGGLLMGGASLGTMVMLALWERPRAALHEIAG
jgi:hypothetical protein